MVDGLAVAIGYAVIGWFALVGMIMGMVVAVWAVTALLSHYQQWSMRR